MEDINELSEQDSQIKWDDFTETDFTNRQEALYEFIRENLIIQKYIRSDYSGYLDYEFSSDEDIEEAVDEELEIEDHIEYDDYDTQQGADNTYFCNHCEKRFNISSHFMEHAIEYVIGEEVDDVNSSVMRPSQFLCFLAEYVWNIPNGTPYQKYMEKYVRLQPKRLDDFFSYMVQQGLIPIDIYEKYTQMSLIDY